LYQKERREKNRKRGERKERKKGERKDRKGKNIEKSLSGAELDINNILSSINKSSKDVLEEKYVSGAEPGIDINFSFIENLKQF